MKQVIQIILFALWVVSTALYAQTTTTKPESKQTQQMLQQVRQLQQIQAKQQQMIKQEQQLQQPQNPPSANVTSKLHSVKTDRSTYSSNFQSPFQQAQLRSTPRVAGLKDQAFSGVVRSVLPMSPQQIHRLKQIYAASQFAAAVPAGTPPKPTATSMYINLAPGASPPSIRLSEGFVSSLVFLDATGAPWPIAAYDLGDPRAFNIAWDKKDNVLMLQAKTLYTYGNLAIRLRGLNTPIMITLIPGQQVVDYRVDITVPGYGPHARPLAIDTGLPSQATPVLLSVLDGIPPEGSKQLTIADDIGEVWQLHGKMYLRTHYTLLSPGWLATMASADGTTAYELQETPMLLVAKNGAIVHVKIGGF